MKEYFSSVLLIEDEAAHAELITRSLRGLVGEVIHVSRGDEGVKALEERFVDLVFWVYCHCPRPLYFALALKFSLCVYVFVCCICPSPPLSRFS